jgi:hypothetical protein
VVPGRLGFSLPVAGGPYQTRPWTLSQIRFCRRAPNTIRADPIGSDNGVYRNFSGSDGAVLSGLKTAAPKDISTHYC